jgi:hypothetical protein
VVNKGKLSDTLNESSLPNNEKDNEDDEDDEDKPQNSNKNQDETIDPDEADERAYKE